MSGILDCLHWHNSAASAGILILPAFAEEDGYEKGGFPHLIYTEVLFGGQKSLGNVVTKGR